VSAVVERQRMYVAVCRLRGRHPPTLHYVSGHFASFQFYMNRPRKDQGNTDGDFGAHFSGVGTQISEHCRINVHGLPPPTFHNKVQEHSYTVLAVIAKLPLSIRLQRTREGT
jgi:hypothetical protein